MGGVGPFVQKALEQSVRTLQVAPSVAEQSGGTALIRCRQAITRARTIVVEGEFARAIRCQQRLDRHATEFGVIAPACLTVAPRVEARAAKRVSSACGSVSGAEVGSCDALPDCVIASARKTAHTLATTTYGIGPGQQGFLCGNGEVDPGETCDDGKANSPNGACTDVCQKATCGDGRVETGVEECDNGQGPHCGGGPRIGLSCATDMDCPPAPCGPTPSCVSDGRNFDSPTCKATCKAARCGDGEHDPGEQCDDGASNGTPGDGCSATCELAPVSCPAGGTIDVSVTLVPNRDTFSSNLVGGMDVSICYTDPLSIPGSGILSVDDPNDPATRIVLLSSTPGGVNLYDGLVTFADIDTTSPTMLRTILALNPTANVIFSQPIPFERIRFDCPSGGQVTENDVPCRIATITDSLARPIQRESYPDCQVTLPR